MDEAGLGEGADVGLNRRERIFTPEQIAAAEDRPLGDLDGVTISQLWSDQRSHAGILRLGPGARIPEHTHEEHAHHIWVIEGRVRVLGRDLVSGSYAYVPPGQPHDLRGREPTGCRVFYTYLTD